MGARRADALVAIASTRLASDPDPDRATVVAHATVGDPNGEIEGGPAIHPSTVARLLCSSRVQMVVQDRGGTVHQVSEATRLARPWMLRQVRYRDRGCRFPGCGTMRFTEAHHVRWWQDGGKTTLENLVLICSFHHKLVHEYGWRIERRGRDLGWLRPSGVRRAGPVPRAPDELSA